MEIYKLKDFGGKGSALCGEADGDFDESGVLRITGMKQGVKNPDRVNVFVNGKFSFSLDVSQVVDLKIRVGLLLSAEKLEELQKASEFGKLYQRTLEWVLLRPRSEKEIRDYLYKKLRMSSSGRSSRPSSRGSSLSPRSDCGLPSEDISKFSERIISRLISKGYVDDVAFAKWYAENRFVKKGVSSKRLKIELFKKGISREIVDEVLDARDDEDEIMKIIKKKRAKYDDEKLISYLLRQGFPFELVNEKVRNSGTD